MRTLKPSELKSIEQFFKLTQPQLLQVMNRYLRTKYKTVYCTNEYIIAVGDIPVALVAHLDTVFSAPPERIFYDKSKNVMWSPEGLGADDRAGVYSIVQLLKRGYTPTIILTTDEEQGCIGAEKIAKIFPKAISDLKYIIQLDRRGSSDCVFYNCDSPEFEEYIETFGFITNFGSFSDISIICPQWKIAGVNLSIGYYDEHSHSETLYIGQMYSTINRVEKMLKDIDNVKYFEYKEIKYKSYIFDDCYGWDPTYGVSKEVWKSWHQAKVVKCEYCNKQDYSYNLYPVKDINNQTVFICPDCLTNTPVDTADSYFIKWCKKCQEPYMTKDKKDRYCQDCRKEKANII